MAELAAVGNRNLSALPGNWYLKIRNHLDVNEDNAGWKLYVAVLSERYEISTDLAEIEKADSPTTRLLNLLGVQGMTITEFVKTAILVKDYFILSIFNVHVPVEITQEPLRGMYILEGESVNLTVIATGCPPPKFKWFKNEVLIDETSEGTYHLHAVSEHDSGEYCCLVYNSDDADFQRWIKPVTVIVSPAPELEIKEHPRSCTVSLHGNALFKCEVWGGGDLQYTWYLGKNRLRDEQNVIQGSNTNELRLYSVSPNFIGCYTCLVRRDQKSVMSKGAILQITEVAPKPVYTATDKVALLMGNYDYRSDNPLSAPKFDVQTLSTIFQSLNFKVVSLLNLTKSEMLAAVYEFKKLVGQGVYCVFYFCGHGFEVANQCFLVPTDAPVLYSYNHCVSADEIFRCLLQQEPQICCMILDICRKTREGQCNPGFLAQDIVERGNAIVCYGTSYGLAAYENKQFGILVNYLKNALALPVDIETVFKELRKAIATDELVSGNASHNSHKQIPEVRTNLLEVNRSFTDPIVYKGHTEDYNVRQMLWEMAHRKPDPIILDFQFQDFDFWARVRLDFQQEFSNVLKIYTSVVHPGPTNSCTAFVSAIPADVAERAKTVTISHSKDRKLCKNYVVINNIQRLKSPMVIKITVKCTGPDVEKTMAVELGFPLVAKLQLWKERQDPNPPRRNQEIDEDQEVKDFVEDFQKLNCH